VYIAEYNVDIVHDWIINHVLQTLPEVVYRGCRFGTRGVDLVVVPSDIKMRWTPIPWIGYKPPCMLR
jgi:hypothetical protein